METSTISSTYFMNCRGEGNHHKIYNQNAERDRQTQGLIMILHALIHTATAPNLTRMETYKQLRNCKPDIYYTIEIM
uniref:Uncharacterized protein n=1 Tax=Octopus bimaculoides TaxID=37653 RepID=A0A0L8FJ61_OCTBM